MLQPHGCYVQWQTLFEKTVQIHDLDQLVDTGFVQNLYLTDYAAP